MYFLCFVIVVLVTLAGSATGAQSLQSSNAAHSRRMLNAAAPAAVQTAKQCMWVAESNSCEATDAVDIMYAVRGQPVSPYLWFLLMTHDRKSACDSYQARDSCRGDVANNCVWLDDVLGDDTPSGSKAKPAGRKGPAAAERATAAAAGVKNLFTSQMSALQNQFGSNLREMMGRTDTPILDRAFERVAGAGKPAAAAAGAAPAPAPSSNKPSSSSGSSSKKRQVKCTSRELIENFVFTKSGYSSVLQAPLALHCPGSKAFNLVKCMGQTSNAGCRSTPGCVVVPRVGSKGATDLCVSDHFNKLSKDGMNQFMYALALAEPSVVGGCDGACWMRQALLCNHTKGADDCSTLSFCRSMGDSCVPKLYASDSFGASVQEYLGECSEVDNKKDCESYKIKLVKKGKYARWAMPAKAADECLVPSVRGMLGRVKATTVEKETAARVEILTMMGAETEKQAFAVAAATAAADAAKAGKLLAERGVTGLQQLYSTASEVLG